VPVRDIAGLLMLDQDETIRANASLEGMAKLDPASR
jgi:acetyl-CoA acetyltransferase